MRPERPDIAAPPFPPAIVWVGDEPPAMERLCAKGPVLVHFFEASEASSFRSLDWVRAWHERYAGAGLTVIGVHTPRSAFARQSGDLELVAGRLGIGFPLANDADRQIWRDYGCRGWPSLFLWRRGGALVWVHFGEGEYQASEAAIRTELAGAKGADPSSFREREGSGTPAAEKLPAPVVAARRSDAEGARVVPPSEEIFPGGSHDVPLEGGGGPLDVTYEAGASYLAASGSGLVSGSIDGADIDPIAIDGPAMVRLAEHGRHGRHQLTLVPGLGTRIWSIGFGAGVP